MLEYNLKGLLIPETIIVSTLAELENEFSIKINSGNRVELFENYKQYCNDLKAVCEVKNIKQWVDGSYVTKSQDPSDIDIVSFVDLAVFQEKGDELKEFIYPQSMVRYKLDAYLIVIYPEHSSSRYITDLDRAFWLDHFGKTKPNRHRKRVPKGFLEIIV